MFRSLMNNHKLIAVAILMAVAFSGLAYAQDDTSPAELYNQAQQSMKDGNTQDAVRDPDHLGSDSAIVP